MVERVSNITKYIYELNQDEINEVHEYLEYNEWGIALETLCAILIEKNVTITKDVFNMIRNAGEIMGIDSSTWKCVQHLIK